MDLKNTINNTNTQKENIKTVATQIDNKLVELGGEQAKDLSDVANKMQNMVGQYKKYASGKDIYATAKKNGSQCSLDITLNINFIPKRIIITNIYFYYWRSGSYQINPPERTKFYYANLDTDRKDSKSVLYVEPMASYNYNDPTELRIENFDLNKKNISIMTAGHEPEGDCEIRYDWIAIG